ncbi:hypothetical protein D3C87_1539110 [compost metagenome]
MVKAVVHRKGRPAPLLFQRVWQVPMVQSNVWYQALQQTFINDLVIKQDPFFIDTPFSVWQNSGPGNRKAENGKAQ